MRMSVEHERLVRMLKESISLMCKSSLNYDMELNVEGLLGITLDKKDVVLVNINESFQIEQAKTCTSPEKPATGQKRTSRQAIEIKEEQDSSPPRSRRRRARRRSQESPVQVEPEEVSADFELPEFSSRVTDTRDQSSDRVSRVTGPNENSGDLDLDEIVIKEEVGEDACDDDEDNDGMDVFSLTEGSPQQHTLSRSIQGSSEDNSQASHIPGIYASTSAEGSMPGHRSIVRSLSDVQPLRCQAAGCCGGYHCPLCNTRVTHDNKRRLQKHINAVHWKPRQQYKDVYVLLCKCSRFGHLGHRHCPGCLKMDTGLARFQKHQQHCKHLHVKTPKPKLTWRSVIKKVIDEAKKGDKREVTTTAEREAQQDDTTSNTHNLDATLHNDQYEVVPPSTAPELRDNAPSPEKRHETSQKVPASRQKGLCHLCGKAFIKKNILKHIQHRHSDDKTDEITAWHHLDSTLIDKVMGIFLVRKIFSGVGVPVHVQKRTWGSSQNTSCLVPACVQAKEVAIQNGIPNFECIHILSTMYASDALIADLDEATLEEMLKEGIATSDIKADCLALKLSAEGAQEPFVALANNSAVVSNRFICGSIFTGKELHWCPFGRVVTFFDSALSEWHCKCRPRVRNCIHRVILMWYLRQEMPDAILVKGSTGGTEPVEESDEDAEIGLNLEHEDE